MNRKKISGYIDTIVVLLIAVGGLLVMAGCAHPTPEQRASWVTSRISRELDLTDDQKSKLEALKQTLLELRKSHEGEGAQHRDQVREMILAEHLDSKKAKSLISEREKWIDEGFDKVFTKLSALHDSLTAEQRKKAAECFERYSRHWDQ